tara:strand:+ start:10582 stop:12489 length:1908 start_codon:yes stop_codon:yes gene_type:complete
MGKQGKRTKKRIKDLNSVEAISLLTPTVMSRKKCLLLLAKCIKNQTYASKISQWVIVSADKEWNEDDFNSVIAKLQVFVPENIKIDSLYITDEKAKQMGDEYVTDDYEAIGYLRNLTNMLATGSFIIALDDDDYYPPLRVEHAVSSLRNSHKLIAGCSPHIMYDADLETVFQFRKFGPNHSVNNSLAYKKEYIDNGNKYDSTKRHAEEKTFLNDYKSEMVQLDPNKTIVQMCHMNNTYNKRGIIVDSSWAGKPEHTTIFKISTIKHKFIPNEYLNGYCEALGYSYEDQSKYDIVYYTGCGCPVWSPYDENLGGSEQAVKHLVESWVKLGYSVAVYGDYSPEVVERTSNDDKTGDWINFKDFKCSLKYKTIILWRYYGIHPTITWSLKADRIYLDIHDIIPLHPSCIDNIEKVDKIMVRSKFHSDEICKITKNCSVSDKMTIIPNGIRVKDFTPDGSIERDPYRFCWCSCYKRGLAQILAWVWPYIKQLEPRASFHIYYGMDNVKEEDFKNFMRNLLAQPGVIDHGRQSVDAVILEKHTASFHLYYSATRAETDCISLRESACAGCIPIISNFNVFHERSGIHLDGNPFDKDEMMKVAYTIVGLMKDTQQLDKIRDSITGKEGDWDKFANEWPLKF